MRRGLLSVIGGCIIGAMLLLWWGYPWLAVAVVGLGFLAWSRYPLLARQGEE